MVLVSKGLVVWFAAKLKLGFLWDFDHEQPAYFRAENADESVGFRPGNGDLLVYEYRLIEDNEIEVVRILRHIPCGAVDHLSSLKAAIGEKSTGRSRAATGSCRAGESCESVF